MNKQEKALEELIKGIKSYVDIAIANAGYDVTTTAIVKGQSSNYGYDIEINGETYNHIETIGGTCEVNETVRVIIPKNKMNNMFILK